MAAFLFLATTMAVITGTSLLFPNPFWERLWDLNRPAYTAFSRARVKTLREAEERGESRLKSGHSFRRIRPPGLVALDDALQALEKVDARKARVVELRFFGGMSVEETAAALSVSPQTVLRDWKLSKSWLMREMNR